MRHTLLSLCIAGLVVACGSRPTVTETTTPVRPSGTAAATGAGAERRAAATPDPRASDPACTLDPVYFEYDSNLLDRRSRDTLASDASCLREHPELRVTLVGGTDERGTEEYNFALGERRARSVHTYLTDSGVESTRLRVHTVGGEWASGGSEDAMARDRRVEPRSADR
jgi:peptidoglycan-associated lipoprotein